MTEQINSQGECLYCKQVISKSDSNKHFNSHLKEKVKTAQAGKSFLLHVETNPKWGASPYFLSLWVDGDCSMGQIDDFLRAIWLDCCGHMSEFTDNNKNRMEQANGAIPMSRATKLALVKGMKLKYEYDFGSTTELLITVKGEYTIKADKKLVLLSRNNPPEILCDLCHKKPATAICTAHGYEEASLFCESCSKKHAKTCPDFEDYSAMTLVNSPRAGVCGYDGGSIDLERDGVFKKNAK
jgi:hypothetical protein